MEAPPVIEVTASAVVQAATAVDGLDVLGLGRLVGHEETTALVGIAAGAAGDGDGGTPLEAGGRLLPTVIRNVERFNLMKPSKLFLFSVSIFFFALYQFTALKF